MRSQCTKGSEHQDRGGVGRVLTWWRVVLVACVWVTAALIHFSLSGRPAPLAPNPAVLSSGHFVFPGISEDMLQPDNTPSPALLLFPEDYPPSFRSPAKLYAHPDDYMVSDGAISPYVFLYRDGTRVRLFYRTSLRTNDGKFTTATFLLDTGGCPALYLSPTLQTLLRDRIEVDDLGTRWIRTNIGGEDVRLLVRFDLPSEHRPANVMGLPMFFLLGLTFPQVRINTLVFDEEGVSTNCAEAHLPYI